MKVGFVAILGRPNVGKSTLLNAILSKKVSIVSPKAQTTRDSISGIYNDSNRQIVFVDTPGIFQGSVKMDRYMRKSAYESAEDVDAIIYIIDASVKELDTDFAAIKAINSEAPIIFVLNKIDLIGPERAIEIKNALHELYSENLIIEASFIENFGIKEVKDAIEPYLLEGLPFYSDDFITDKDKAFQAKEIIRERLLRFLKEEIPHQAAVKINSLDKKKGGYWINATLIVNKDSHKGIVIGKGGEMIKKISMSSRHELERMWHEHITNLEIEVISIPSWRDNLKVLAELGYAI